jgi:NAD(P)-dependent dehydrogenase (short-subunit alcohol dehydrogenase family)
MSELRFDGRVAVVTGAGRSIGRAHAMLLAARGAKVVVNDFGGTKEGAGSEPELAAAVVDEIVAAGGEAVANSASVADLAGARSVVADGLEHFGRIDAVINNAGIMTNDEFATLPAEVLHRVVAVNLFGSFYVSQAAWPHFVDQGYGRILNTTSAGMFGAGSVVSYSSAKASVVGLTRSLAQIGAPHGIKVNAYAPSAYTRLVGDPSIRRTAGVPGLGTTRESRGQPEDVAPAAVFLVHEECPVSGEIIASTGANVARIFTAATRGYTQDGMTMENLRDNWAEVVEEDGYFVARTTADYLARRAEVVAS